jgi:hypothetical protein
MFPSQSSGAIVPFGTVPLAAPLAAESERQATLPELMPYFLGYGKVELRWAPGTLEKYEDAIGWVIRRLGDIAPEKRTLWAWAASSHVSSKSLSSASTLRNEAIFLDPVRLSRLQIFTHW